MGFFIAHLLVRFYRKFEFAFPNALFIDQWAVPLIYATTGATAMPGPVGCGGLKG
jgi:hypothetical protein